ncbi:MAG: IS3 family transposase [Clostridiales bacterium]|nr:IS3 family transposase [Clostridiales bacterium]
MRHEYPIKLLCEVLNISRATFYKYRNPKTQDFPNLLNGDFKAEQNNEKWVTDITYLAYEGRYAYLSTIIDLHSRDIVAAVISNRNDLKLVKDTLEMALSKEKDVHGVILHSDQGFQYTSYEYRAICEANGITISMSRKGTPSDNAPIESFHSSLKRETLYSYVKHSIAII